MTETEVKDLILQRMTELIPNATSIDMSYMAEILKILESLGKSDFSEKYMNTLIDLIKEMQENSKKTLNLGILTEELSKNDVV